MPDIAAEMKLKVFISYSRKDHAFAEKVVAALEARGIEPRIDTRDLPKLEDWQRELLGFIREADAVVFIVSSNSISSAVCAWEVEQVAKLNKRLAPIVLEHVSDDRIPEAIAKINYLFFDRPEQVEPRFDELARALLTDLAWLKEHTRIGELARRWEERGRPGGLLLRGQELREAERWIASRPRNAPEPTDAHRDLIARSGRGAIQRRNAWIGGLAAGLVVAIGLAGVAVWQSYVADAQRKQVVEREMNRRAALAQDLASAGRTAVASAVALDAVRGLTEDQAPTPELRAAIHRTLNLRKVPIERYIGENVFSLALSPDGKTLAGGTVKGKVHVLDAATLEQRHELELGTDNVSGLDFSPDGKRLLATGDKIPKVWDVATGKKLFDLDRPNAARSAYRAQFSPDGRLIVIATSENRALLHDGLTGKLLHVLPAESYEEMRARWEKSQDKNGFGVADPIVDAVNRANYNIFGAATDAIFSPDGRLVAVTGPSNPDGSVRLFDATSGKLVRTLVGGRGAGMVPPLGYGNTLAFSPDGANLVAAPVFVTVKVWGVQDGRLRAEFPIRGISSFLLTGDGAALLSAHENGSIIFRCLSQNSAVVSLQGHDGAVDSLSADRVGQMFATGATDRTARIWRMPRSSDICGYDQAGKEFDSLSLLRPSAILSEHGARITKVVFAPDNRAVFTASQDGWVRAWSLGPDGETTEIVLPEQDYWERANPSSDGRAIFAYNSRSYRWLGWDTGTGKPLDMPDRTKAVAPGSDRGPVLFRSPFSHSTLGRPAAEDDSGWSSWSGPVSADGTRVVAERDGKHVLLDSGTRQTIATLAVDGRAASDLLFSPDGSRLFGRLAKEEKDKDSEHGLAVWDAQSGRLVASMPAIGNLGQHKPMSVSHNGSRVLALLGANELLLLELAGNELKVIGVPETGSHFGSGRSITAAALSSDGRYLLAGRSDGAIVIADVDHGSIWRVLDTYRSRIKAAEMSRDGRFVVATDEADTFWVFDTASGAVVRSATVPVGIVSMFFLPGTDRLAVLDQRKLTIFRALPSFGGSSDTKAMVAAARKLGFSLVSHEDRQRYKLGGAAAPTQPEQRRYAAINPNSEGTAPVVWAETAEKAHELSVAACQRLSSTCSSRPASTDDMEEIFVYYCCTSPRLGCAVTAGSGDEPLRSAKEILAKASYSSCEVRAAINARDGSAR